jgi:hypothetical protein
MLLGSMSAKAVCRTLMKLTPGGNPMIEIKSCKIKISPENVYAILLQLDQK